jgi:ribosomal protein L40E
MSSKRPNLTLDEQSFQGLLSAAYTIQEHNERLKQAQQAEEVPTAPQEAEVPQETEATPESVAPVELGTASVCPHCGAQKPGDAVRCESCGQDEFHPGERLQRNWASMWLMSQEQGKEKDLDARPERVPEISQGTEKGNAATLLEALHNPQVQPFEDHSTSSIPATPVTAEAAQKPAIIDLTRDDLASEDRTHDKPTINDLTIVEAAIDEPAPSHPIPIQASTQVVRTPVATASLTQESLAREYPDLDSLERTYLAQAHLARIYLDRTNLDQAVQSDPLPSGEDSLSDDASVNDSSPSLQLREAASLLRDHRADLYLGVALLVAVLALLWPVAGSSRQAALSLWDKSLIELGIAEAPAPVVHVLGDPTIRVWIDTHTAIYYCPGADQYGKTANGRYSTQRDAQMERFEPAARTPCN